MNGWSALQPAVLLAISIGFTSCSHHDDFNSSEPTSFSFDIGDPSASNMKSPQVMVFKLNDGRFAYIPPVNRNFDIEDTAARSLAEFAQIIRRFDNSTIVNGGFPDVWLRPLTVGEFSELKRMVLSSN